MARNPQAADQVERIRRVEEEVRQLRLRTGDTPPEAWRLLQPYLNPKWDNAVYGSNTDLTNEFCPRFYRDRDRVFFGGVVQLDDSITGMGIPNKDTIFAGFPAAVKPRRQQSVQLFEDRYWTNVLATAKAFTGYFWSPSGVAGDNGGLVFVDHATDGIAVALDQLSYRIGL